MSSGNIFTVPDLSVDLICEQGHTTAASVNIPLGVNLDSGEFVIICGDAWIFCDFCKPCENFEACMSGEACDVCLRVWRSEDSKKKGFDLAVEQLNRLISQR